MTWNPQNLIQLYVEGNMPSEAVPEFDRLVKQDPAFCESLVEGLSRDLGPVPEGSLDQMSARLDARYDQIFKGSPSATVKKAENRVPVLPILSAMHSIAPETLIFSCVVALFAALSFITLTNPIQRNGQTLETSQIQKYDGTESFTQSTLPATTSDTLSASGVPVAAKRVSSFVPKSVKAAVSAPSRPAQAAPVPKAPVLVESNQASDQTAEGLVELAMQSVPGSHPEGWVETTGPRSDETQALPALPLLEETPSYVTQKGDLLRLSIPLDQAQAVQVKVADSKGKIVRNLFSGQWEAGPHTLDWDVKDDRGKILKAGQYDILVEAAGKTSKQIVTIK